MTSEGLVQEGELEPEPLCDGVGSCSCCEISWEVCSWQQLSCSRPVEPGGSSGTASLPQSWVLKLASVKLGVWARERRITSSCFRNSGEILNNLMNSKLPALIVSCSRDATTNRAELAESCT